MASPCFLRHIQTRPIKRIEALRGLKKSRGTSSTNGRALEGEAYIVALSGGPSSLGLLHILATHINSMLKKSGRTSYTLHMVHVSETLVDEENSTHTPDASTDEWLDRLRAAYPQFPLTSIPLSSSLDSWTPPSSLLSKTHTVSSFSSLPAEDRLGLLAACAKSRTAQYDLNSILLDHALHSVAQQHGIKSIMRGDSATRLAETVLGDVAKGRGGRTSSTLSEAFPPNPLETDPDLTSAETSERGNHAQSKQIRTAFPMREVVRKDAVSYCMLATLSPPQPQPSSPRPSNPSAAPISGSNKPSDPLPLSSSSSSSSSSSLHHLHQLLLNPPHPPNDKQEHTQSQSQTQTRPKPRTRMMRDLAIDELVHDYFAQVEEQYPGIVSNVVRTVGKLGPALGVASRGSRGPRGSRRCGCCGGFVERGERVGAGEGSEGRGDGNGDGRASEGVQVEGAGETGEKGDGPDSLCERCERDFGS
ncbi:Cytoplasmic tRNA 2-thiolation protein 2 [Sphaceloma murrayae]|uniref:Cytoplasmic tRNA 2-thiolation protein 2 n=1 Tax=Sphaceloma murrayae TaxID=2082308 RepID=A0A2K1QWH5_9PEZI|nr:Cytoplasmic tRNA 2-thiolation protein 2 [Sphaceloma murrayae]